MTTTSLESQIAALQRLDTCSVANAIEAFAVRLRNEGFTHPPLHCFFPEHPPMVGCAATLKVRCSSPPMGGRNYCDRSDWWEEVLKVPAPRVIVIEDADPVPGTGALIGEVHAHILRALGCVGAVTNGSVRDLPAISKLSLVSFWAMMLYSCAACQFPPALPATLGETKGGPERSCSRTALLWRSSRDRVVCT